MGTSNKLFLPLLFNNNDKQEGYKGIDVNNVIQSERRISPKSKIKPIVNSHILSVYHVMEIVFVFIFIIH